jgi:hypothetical protein
MLQAGNYGQTLSLMLLWVGDGDCRRAVGLTRPYARITHEPRSLLAPDWDQPPNPSCVDYGS